MLNKWKPLLISVATVLIVMAVVARVPAIRKLVTGG